MPHRTLSSLPLDDAAGECVTHNDCDTARGTPPCRGGSHECVEGRCRVICPDCSDHDFDGYGVGNGCAGGDCDDEDRDVGPSASAPCYDGPAGTEGVGVCAGGTRDCQDGRWGACLGSTLPSPESCNDRDDDCDGDVDEGFGMLTCGLGACQHSVAACLGGRLVSCTPRGSSGTEVCDGAAGDEDCDGRVDEGCLSTCLWVGPSGDDGSRTPTDPRTPLRTIGAAIARASSGSSGPRRVCLLADSCDPTSSPTRYREEIRMAAGVSVQGNYALSSIGSSVTRCGFPSRTVIENTSPEGVRFPERSSRRTHPTRRPRSAWTARAPTSARTALALWAWDGAPTTARSRPQASSVRGSAGGTSRERAR